MSYDVRPGIRDNVGLLIGLAGASGSGKTFTAFRLAKGLAGAGRKFLVLDTEGRRALHYGRPSAQFDFDFDHIELRPPYRPETFLEAIRYGEQQGYPAVIADSFSDEWAGEGGMLDWHEEEMQRRIREAQERARRYNDAPPNEAFLREKLSMTAWIEPKIGHKGVISRLRYTKTHVIFCLRAEDKMRIEERVDDQGRKKTVYIQAKDLPPKDRWVPICCHNPEFMYELTLSAVLTPDNPGVPIFTKLQEQHKAAFEPDRPITERTGELLAAWARGDAESSASAGEAPQTAEPSSGGAPPTRSLKEVAETVARGGMEDLRAWWARQSRATKRELEPDWPAVKKIAEEADERAGQGADL